jgi:hypothetical protein
LSGYVEYHNNWLGESYEVVSFLECKSLCNIGDGKPVQFDESVFTKQKNSAGQYCHNNG